MKKFILILISILHISNLSAQDNKGETAAAVVAGVAGVVGAGLVGGALAPELAGMSGAVAGAEALGIVEEGALTGGEIASALGGLGVSAGAA